MDDVLETKGELVIQLVHRLGVTRFIRGVMQLAENTKHLGLADFVRFDSVREHEGEMFKSVHCRSSFLSASLAIRPAGRMATSAISAAARVDFAFTGFGPSNQLDIATMSGLLLRVMQITLQINDP